jgi:ketosteroid isomerase-like protein
MLSNRLGQGLLAALIAASLGAAMAAAAAPAPAASDAETLHALQQSRNGAIAAHDAERLGALMAEDMSFSSQVLHRQGRSDVLAAWSGLWKRRPDLAIRFDPDRTRLNPAMNVAAETGRWTETWSEADGPVRLSGTYLTVWSRNSAGAWQIAAETIAPLRCKGGAYCRR